MADERRRYHEFANTEVIAGDFVQVDRCGHVPNIDGEKWGRQVAGEPFPQSEGRTRRSPDMHLVTRLAQWPEESQTLNMIQVQMGQQDVYAA